MLVNLCYVSQDAGVIKVSNSKIGLTIHSKALIMVTFDKQHRTCLVFILYRFRDIITYIPKFKEAKWPEHLRFGSNISCMH